MRDLIWTLIVIWLIYKLVDMFKAVTATKKAYVNNQQQPHKQQGQAQHPHSSEQNIKSAIQKHLNNEGEYVDFEEVK